MPKRTIIGVVTGDKMSLTRRVEVERRVQHPMYGKFIGRRTVCYVHDEQEESKLGETVEIIESRRRSKKKRWELVRVVSRSQEVDLAALRAAQEQQHQDQEQQEEIEQTPANQEAQTPQEAPVDEGAETTS